MLYSASVKRSVPVTITDILLRDHLELLLVVLNKLQLRKAALLFKIKSGEIIGSERAELDDLEIRIYKQDQNFCTIAGIELPKIL